MSSVRNVAFGLAGAGILFGFLANKSGSIRVSRLTFVRVAQGDCTVMQTPRFTFMVDCGAKNDFVDAGERLAAPELYRLGVRSLDMVCITHPDSDHVGGLVALSRRFEIGKVVISNVFRSNKDMLGWLNSARIPESKRLWVSGHQSFTIDGFAYDIYAPDASVAVTDNDGSLFIRISNGPASALLTGDASAHAEVAMMARWQGWNSQILKAGHHGSRFSSCLEWVNAVLPKEVVFSAGRNNPYGHPSPLIMDRFRQNGAVVHRTDEDGSISYELTSTGFKLLKN